MAAEQSHSQALGAVGDTGGAELGGLEEDLGVGHGGGGEGEDGGGKLHFDGWGLGIWLREIVILFSSCLKYGV